MREFQEFKDSELQLAQLAKELKEGTFVYHMNKAIAAHERGDAKKKQMHLDNAKTARYSMKSTEIAKHKDLLDKYSQMREEVELDEAETGSHKDYASAKKQADALTRQAKKTDSIGDHRKAESAHVVAQYAAKREGNSAALEKHKAQQMVHFKRHNELYSASQISTKGTPLSSRGHMLGAVRRDLSNVKEETEQILASDEFAALDEESKRAILARLAHIIEGASHDSETHYEHSNNKKSSCNENRATISFRAFLAKLEEAKKYVEEDEDDEEERADERAGKKSDRRGRMYPVKMHAGDDDGKNLGEESELDEGQTVKTKTGMIHKGTYGSEYEGNEKKKEAPAVKRGRGRPKKGSDESGNAKKYTFHDLLNRLSR